jgi:hypothetical protein
MNLKTNKMNENQKHELAKLFMEQFPSLEPMSLDEFLSVNSPGLYPEQINLGNYILTLFEE